MPPDIQVSDGSYTFSALSQVYYCICVLILLYMCPHTTIHLSSCYNTSVYQATWPPRHVLCPVSLTHRHWSTIIMRQQVVCTQLPSDPTPHTPPPPPLQALPKACSEFWNHDDSDMRKQSQTSQRWGLQLLVYEAFSYWCMRPSATSVWGLQLRQWHAKTVADESEMRPSATRAWDLQLLVYEAFSH
jgi:hypothetical protein